MKTYEQIGAHLIQLLEQKRQAYGDGFNGVPQIIEILYPNGIDPQDYANILTLTRILDKIYRISNNDKSEDAWLDIAGYCFLAMRARDED